MLLKYSLIWIMICTSKQIISVTITYSVCLHLTSLLPADLKLCAPEPQVLQNERLHHQSGPQVPSVGAYTGCRHLAGLKKKHHIRYMYITLRFSCSILLYTLLCGCVCLCVPEGLDWCPVVESARGNKGSENISASLGCCRCIVTKAHSFDNGRMLLATS